MQNDASREKVAIVAYKTDKTRNYRNLLRAIEMPENFE